MRHRIKRPRTDFRKEKSLTQQEFKEETDINCIMAKTSPMKENAMMPVAGSLRFGDFSEGQDFKTCLNKVNEAREAFMSIPSDIRKKFDNRPEKFIEFCSKEENREEIKKMGLLRAVEGPSEADRIVESVDRLNKTMEQKEPVKAKEKV